MASTTRLIVAAVSGLMLSWCAASAVAEDLYFATQVKLETPKVDGKRSREGGLEHAPFRLWLPDGVKTVRGVICNPMYTKAVTQKHWQAAGRQWQFGILATNCFGVKNDELAEMVNAALATLAEESGHSELRQAPMCLVGMSAGAGMCARIAEQMPQRTIAMGPVCLEVGPRGSESLGIPTMTIFGERDGKQYEKLMAKLPEVRGEGGRFSIAVQWGRRHEFGQANNLLLPLFDAAIRQRLGQPGEPLKAYPEESGWLGAVSQWKQGKVEIAPYADFHGDPAKACWFPNKATAHAWKAFVSHEPQLKIRTPPGLGDGQPLMMHRKGKAITLEIATQPATAGPIEVCAGDEVLGHLEKGKLQLTFARSGFYPIYLQAISADGHTIRSRVHTLIVE